MVFMSFTIRIPKNILPMADKLKEGDKVDWGKESMQERTEEEKVIHLSDELGIPAKDIFKYIRVNLGEKLASGDIIAEKKGLIGGKKIASPEPAEVRGINHTDGSLTLSIVETVEVPFVLEAKFIKRDKEEFLFHVREGAEYEVASVMERTFGGVCSYIKEDREIDLDSVERKVVVASTEHIIDMAKIAALDPSALVAYASPYHHHELPQAIFKNKEEWKSLLHKKWSHALYLAGDKIIYFYNP